MFLSTKTQFSKWQKGLCNFRRFCTSEVQYKTVKRSLYVINMNKDRKIDGLITVEELPNIQEFAKASYLINSKPEKSIDMIKSLLKKLRGEYFGLPLYVHLLMFYSEAFKSNNQFDEAEMQIKNCIVQSEFKEYFTAETRIKYKINLLELYINHFPEKCKDYAIKLSNDPDLLRIDSEVAAVVWNMIGIGLFISQNEYFDTCKKCLKKAIALSSSDKLLSVICHNLAVMNYFEINFHNDRILNSEKEEELNKKAALAEMFYKDHGLDDKIKQGEHKDGMVNLRASELENPKNKEKDRNFIKEKIEQLRNKTKFSNNPHENLKIKKLVSKREKEIDRKVQKQKLEQQELREEESNKSRKEMKMRSNLILKSKHLGELEVEYLNKQFLIDNKDIFNLKEVSEKEQKEKKFRSQIYNHIINILDT